MLQIKDFIRKEGYTMIGDVNVVYHYAEIDTFNNNIMQMHSSIVDYGMYKANCEECRQNIKTFEDEVFAMVEELNAEQTAEGETE